MDQTADMRQITLGELFSKEECYELEKILTKKNTKQLLEYLTSREDALLVKGVDSKYLYYALCFKFQIE